MQTNSTILVTGGTGGIGREVALQLAEHGQRVLFVGRDLQRGQEVLSALRARQPLEHAFIPADLSLLAETSRVADAVAAHTDRLDAAVFCAGILSLLPEWTEEQLERNLVLNYLTRYLLARRLLPMLSSASSGRLVFVANAGVYRDSLDLADLNHRQGKPGLDVAGRTQFANDLLTIELAERLRGSSVEVTCVFPGPAKTGVFDNARGLPWHLRALVPLLRLTAAPAVDAARTPVFLAQSDRAKGTNGKFFGPAMKERPVPERARRVERRRALWDASEQLVQSYLRG
jgi:NAD(P)-dependent dehydrogenase (short-subunit alcohol dehydrogenase family)